MFLRVDSTLMECPAAEDLARGVACLVEGHCARLELIATPGLSLRAGLGGEGRVSLEWIVERAGRSPIHLWCASDPIDAFDLRDAFVLFDADRYEALAWRFPWGRTRPGRSEASVFSDPGFRAVFLFVLLNGLGHLFLAPAR